MSVKNLRHLSQFDPGQVMKNVHDELGSSLRVSQANSKVPPGFSKVQLTYNAEGSVTEACFFAGIAAEKTKVDVVADVAGSLNSKAFLLYNAEDDPQAYVWYNVDGTGVDPAINDLCGIEVPISVNDPVSIVARASELFINNSQYFRVTSCNNGSLTIENIQPGQATNSVDVDTGFTITTLQEGASTLIKTITLPEDSGVKYVFNHAEGKFETHLTDITVTVEPADAVDTPAVINSPAAAAATEYSFVLPNGTKRYQMQVRGGGIVTVQYAFAAGQSGTTFFTLPPGNVHYEEGLVLSSSLTIYFQMDKPGKVLEVMYWT